MFFLLFQTETVPQLQTFQMDQTMAAISHILRGHSSNMFAITVLLSKFLTIYNAESMGNGLFLQYVKVIVIYINLSAVMTKAN